MLLHDSKGESFQIDDEDYTLINQYTWHVNVCRNGSVRQVKTRKSGRAIYLSRLVMNAPYGMVVDHINGDTCDNRKSNLRICSVHDNLKNKRIYKCNKSGYKGVEKREGRNYRAVIRINGKNINGGTFSTAERAAERYNELAKEHFGDFARLNEIPSIKLL